MGPVSQEVLIDSTPRQGTGEPVQVWKAELPRGFLFPSDYEKACSNIGMKPVCMGSHNCSVQADSNCLALAIERDHCLTPMKGIAKYLGSSLEASIFQNICYSAAHPAAHPTGGCRGGQNCCTHDGIGNGTRYTLCGADLMVDAGFLHHVRTEKAELHQLRVTVQMVTLILALLYLCDSRKRVRMAASKIVNILPFMNAAAKSELQEPLLACPDIGPQPDVLATRLAAAIQENAGLRSHITQLQGKAPYIQHQKSQGRNC